MELLDGRSNWAKKESPVTSSWSASSILGLCLSCTSPITRLSHEGLAWHHRRTKRLGVVVVVTSNLGGIRRSTDV
ncbi:MAG: hypothetical protein ACI96M_001657 [Candidatus Azotimanducaceae bacterium]